MLKNGSFAVAVVQRQVVIVQAARTHTKRDKFIEVTPYTPFGGDGLFLASPIATTARIPSRDVLSVLSVAPESYNDRESLDSESCSLTSNESSEDQVDYCGNEGMVRLPGKLFEEYVRLSEQQGKRHERVWSAWVSKRR